MDGVQKALETVQSLTATGSDNVAGILPGSPSLLKNLLPFYHPGDSCNFFLFCYPFFRNNSSTQSMACVIFRPFFLYGARFRARRKSSCVTPETLLLQQASVCGCCLGRARHFPTPRAMTANSLEKHILSIVCSVFDAYSAVCSCLTRKARPIIRPQPLVWATRFLPTSPILPGRDCGWIIREPAALLVPTRPAPEQSGPLRRRREASIKAFMAARCPRARAVRGQQAAVFLPTRTTRYRSLRGAGSPASRAAAADRNWPGTFRHFCRTGRYSDLRFRYKRWPQFLQNYLRTMARRHGLWTTALSFGGRARETYWCECESARLLLMDGEIADPAQAAALPAGCSANDQPVVPRAWRGSASVLPGKLPDMPDFSGTAMCMPVMVNKSTRGVLCLAHTSPRQIDESMQLRAPGSGSSGAFSGESVLKPACGLICCPRPRCTATTAGLATRIPRPMPPCAKNCNYVPAAFFAFPKTLPWIWARPTLPSTFDPRHCD